MKWADAATNPSKPGWYVVRYLGTACPRVLWWGASTREWRAGAVRVQVTHYLGPIPWRNEEPTNEA